ncbi:MAG TPA: hypothetical protein PKL48_12055 [Thermodesulfobacteriota bacterium]|nr:hypothetical protein [Thermodesulfobacteriota bacterium]
MRKEERDRLEVNRKVIEAVVNFVNYDFKKSTLAEALNIAALLDEALSSAHRSFFLVRDYFYQYALKNISSKEFRDKASSVQKEWRGVVDFILEHADRPMVLRYAGPEQFFFYGEGTRFSLQVGQMPWLAIPIKELEVSTGIIDDLGKYVEKGKQIFPYGADVFFEALSGFPVSVIKGCPACGKIFTHFSKREKEYCSVRCQHNTAELKGYHRRKGQK